MNTYAIVPHTADMRLKVESNSLSELFQTALLGMAEILKKDYKMLLNKHPNVAEIAISAPDETALLIDFLSEVLTRSQVDKAIFFNAQFLVLEPTRLVANAYGEKLNENGKFDEDIKAVTYHEANIVKNKKGNLETIIVFDI